ncbi:radical SAM protein [Candidatus Dependentiae bacterium]|nr:radical SAM protein [Candidatus Dependentiae bacterium]
MINKKFPFNVFLSVTNRCNFNCTYCYGEYSKRNNFEEFTTREIIDILDELKKLGTVLLQIQGGEPLIRNDIREILLYASKLKFNLDLITNGTLISKNIDAIKCLDSICISLDGREKTNDKNRGAGSFYKIIDGIKTCRELKLTTRINSVITTDTEIEDINFLAEFSKKNKCLLNFGTAFDFQPITLTNNYDCLNYDRNHYNSIIDRILYYKDKKYPVQFTKEAYNTAKNWPFPLKKFFILENEIPENYKYYRCYHGEYVCFIDGDGRMYPCCNFWNKYENINVRKSGFKKGWEKISRNNCAACYNFSYVDRNQIINFKSSAFINYVKNYIYDLKG